MSNPIQSVPTPSGEFQAHFGGPPGAADLAAECKKWEKLCGELLAEREKLRAEVAQQRIAQWHKEFRPEDYDEAVGFANLDAKPTLRELIAELENAPEK